MNQLPPTLQRDADKKSGFTLLEISIVLVIIGLLISGILVGQDLIAGAQVRAQAAQIQSLDTSLNTFRTKYNSLPGDVTPALANQFGFLTTNRSGGAGVGDGNGLVEAYGAGNSTAICGETSLVWNDLSVARLIEGTYSGVAGTGVAACGNTAAAGTLPPAKIGGFVGMYSTNSQNFYEVSNVTALSAAGAPTATGVFPVIQAYNIDVKMDDGIGNTGGVVALDGSGAYNLNFNGIGTAYAANTCLTNAVNPVGSSATNAYYTVSAAAQSGKNCKIRFRSNT